MNFHSHIEIRLSVPEWMWIVIGIRLIRNEVLTVFTIEVGVFLRLSDRSGRIIGVSRIVRVSSMNVFMTSVWSITFTWTCTKVNGS